MIILGLILFLKSCSSEEIGLNGNSDIANARGSLEQERAGESTSSQQQNVVETPVVDGTVSGPSEKEGDFVTESESVGDESLVLPYQTTGMFLTGDCRWARNGGFEFNVIRCRLETEDGSKFTKQNIETFVFHNNVKIDAATIFLPDSRYWSTETTLAASVQDGVEFVFKGDEIEPLTVAVTQIIPDLAGKGFKTLRKVGPDLPVDRSLLREIGFIDLLEQFKLPVGTGMMGPDSAAVFEEVADENVTVDLFAPPVDLSQFLCGSDGQNVMLPSSPANDSFADRVDWDYSQFYRDGITGTSYSFVNFFSGYESQLLPAFDDAMITHKELSECKTEDANGNPLVPAPGCERTKETHVDLKSGYCLSRYQSESVPAHHFPGQTCDVAVFQSLTMGDDSNYLMGIGKERLDNMKVSANLTGLPIKEALKMALESYPKCADF